MTLTDEDTGGLTFGTAPRASNVADNVFALTQPDGTWGLSNAALIVSDGESLLVDTFFTERRNVLLRQLVDAIAPCPPQYLVNTHHHGDHVHGNGWFPEAVVIAHQATREMMARLDPSVSARRFDRVEFGEVRVTLPTVTFRDSLRVHVGELAVDVLSPAIAHCPGNTVVHVPERGVLVAGDLLLSGCTPTFVGGSASGFLSVLDHLRALSADVIVTGHGEVCGADVIDRTASYVTTVIQLAGQAVRTGQTPLKAARAADLGEFAGWLDSERIVGNLHRAMSEMRGGSVDLAEMWRDTTAYLGRNVGSRA